MKAHTALVGLRQAAVAIGLGLLTWAAAPAFAAGPEQALRRASILVEAGRLKEAVAILKEVEPQSRDDDLALNVLTGKIYLAIDRPAKALEFFEEADAQALENFDAAIGAAQANLQLGRFAQARRYVQAARRLDQDSPEPDYVVAVIAHRTGKATPANRARAQAKASGAGRARLCHAAAAVSVPGRCGDHRRQRFCGGRGPQNCHQSACD